MTFVMALCFSVCAILAFPVMGEAEAPENLIGMRLHGGGMTQPTSFELREDKGEVLFSCRFPVGDKREILLEKTPVAPEYMRRLRDLVKQHGFAQMRERDNSDTPIPPDAPVRSMTLEWPENKSLRLNFWPVPDAVDEVENLFLEIADSRLNKAGKTEDIAALYYGHAHREDAESFTFSLREDEGEYLFSAHYFTEDNEKVVVWDAPVDSAHMKRLRAVITKHGLTAMRGEALHKRPRSAPPEPYIWLHLYWPDMRFMHLAQPASGNRELQTFFRDLAQRCRAQWESSQEPETLSWLTFTCTRANEAESFRFHLREVNASVELMARCLTREGKKLDFYAAVDRAYMDQLRAIVKQHGLVPTMKKLPYAERERSLIEDPFPCVLTIDWRDDPSLRLPSFPAPGGEELEAFFRNLAEKYAQ